MFRARILHISCFGLLAKTPNFAFYCAVLQVFALILFLFCDRPRLRTTSCHDGRAQDLSTVILGLIGGLSVSIRAFVVYALGYAYDRTHSRPVERATPDGEFVHTNPAAVVELAGRA